MYQAFGIDLIQGANEQDFKDMIAPTLLSMVQSRVCSKLDKQLFLSETIAVLCYSMNSASVLLSLYGTPLSVCVDFENN